MGIIHQHVIRQVLFYSFLIFLLLTSGPWARAETDTDKDGPTIENTPYGKQKVVFEFYFDNPAKLGTALYWIRSLVFTLGDKPYDIAPDDLHIKVVIHGTGLVTLAKKNYQKYHTLVERMRYYADLGVDFRVCGQAMKTYGYKPKDMQDFITIVPSAITEMAHWQLKGYALITPRVFEKRFTVEELQ